jgi:hypothetical protein
MSAAPASSISASATSAATRTASIRVDLDVADAPTFPSTARRFEARDSTIGAKANSTPVAVVTISVNTRTDRRVARAPLQPRRESPSPSPDVRLARAEDWRRWRSQSAERTPLRRKARAALAERSQRVCRRAARRGCRGASSAGADIHAAAAHERLPSPHPHARASRRVATAPRRIPTEVQAARSKVSGCLASRDRPARRNASRSRRSSPGPSCCGKIARKPFGSTPDTVKG